MWCEVKNLKLLLHTKHCTVITVPGEDHWPATSQWQTLSHTCTIIYSTMRGNQWW
jgi:hypothetical protein